MKQFFTVVFGGLAALIAGVGIAYTAGFAWKAAVPRISEWTGASISAAAASIGGSGSVTAEDGTVVRGLRRTMAFSAVEEEDLINSAVLSLPAGADGKVTAAAYVVRNLTRGDVRTELDADRLLPIASLTKLVTAAVARRLIDETERVTLGRSILDTYGNTAGFKMGETLRAGDLLYPLLMVSSNDAAEAFAQHYGRAKFMKAMNSFVQEIGAYRTYFDDPSGLSAKNVSTANDLAIIIDWIRRHDPEILAITKLKSKTVRAHTWVNPTHFLSWSNYIGGKNGYTEEANRTSVSLFELGPNKNIYVVVVLGSGSRDADVLRLVNKVDE